MVVEPFTFDDAQHIADHLKNRKPVVVNLGKYRIRSCKE